MNDKANIVLVETNSEEFYRQIGKNIQYFRKNLGLKQTDIGRIVGVSPQQIQKYESSQTTVSSYMLFLIANVLKVSMHDLVFFRMAQVEEKEVKKEKKYARSVKRNGDEF